MYPLIPSLPSLAVPGVLALISFLAFTSQLLFLSIEPHPLTPQQALLFNALVLCLLVSYARACITNPGHVPRALNKDTDAALEGAAIDSAKESLKDSSQKRWCRKCENYKPPRAHHCKACKRCIPKMDHHCPWTVNCVSHRTLPHFIRFILYAVSAMLYLEYFLYQRAAVLWSNRNLPSYLGPTFLQLSHLFTLIVLNSLTLFALSILLVRTLWNLGANTTTIEGWEIERHEALLRRARHFGGYLDGPNGVRVQIVRQEFPYDVGIWRNVKQGMGSGNVIGWFWPLAASPSNESGLHFEVNEFEDPSLSWPPPDPDRIPRQAIHPDRPANAFIYGAEGLSNQDELEAFRQRQEKDLQRWNQPNASFQRRMPFHRRYDGLERKEVGSDEEVSDDDNGQSGSGEEAWRNSEGERLADFGVDEEVEFYDEDEVPLSELIRRRKAAAMDRDGRQ